MKKTLIIAAALIAAIAFVGCTTDVAPTAKTLEVSVDLGGARAIGDAGTTGSVTVIAVATDRSRISTVNLTNTAGVWKGEITIPDVNYGDVKFIASAFKADGGIVAHGESTVTIGADTAPFAITTTGYTGTSAKSYNFSSLVGTSPFSVDATTVFDDLSFIGTLTAENNSKTFVANDNGTINATIRLKTNGTGSVSNRAISVPVTGPCILTICAITGSSSNLTRPIGVYSSVSSSEYYETPYFASGTDVTVFNVPYTGTAGDLIMYSKDSGINFYYIAVTYAD
jgi:hypothetical protein